MEEKSDSQKPHVTLFGKNIDSDEDNSREDRKKEKRTQHREQREYHCCREHDCNCKGTNFGLVILSAGVILILNTLGVVSWDFWQYAFSFWPAFLILLGIRIFLGRNVFTRIITWLLKPKQKESLRIFY